MIAIKQNSLILEMKENEKEQAINKMLDQIVQKLSIVLFEPENEIVKQGDEGDAMFFI